MKRKPADGERCFKAAFEYRKYGWSVLALCNPDHDGFGDWHKCDSPGKRPWHAWKEYQNGPATKTEIKGWWSQHPNSNVGIALGSVTGLVRIDVDGPEAEAELQRLSKGELPPTLKFTGGRRESYGLLYAIPEGVTLKTTPKPGGIALAGGEVRLQAKGAQTVLPPSRHPSGKLYRWCEGCGPDDIEAVPMPKWMIEAMRPEQRSSGRSSNRRTQLSNRMEVGGPINDGQRNSTLTSYAGRLRKRGCSEDVIAANLLAVNSARCCPPLCEQEVRSIAHSIARYAPGSVVSQSDNDGIRVVVKRDKRPGHYIIHATVEV